jgi:hypothetical protein
LVRTKQKERVTMRGLSYVLFFFFLVGRSKSSGSKSNSQHHNEHHKSAGFLSRTLSSKRDRSNSVGRNRRPSPPPPPTNSSPLLSNTTTNLQMKYTPIGTDRLSDDNSSGNSTPQLSPLKDLPSGAFGKARDRSTFKGVIDKFVGSFNGN